MVKIFVGNCSDGSTSDDLRSYFGRYGRVLEADVLEGKGFGFVHMESQSDANAAVAALDGADFKGRKLRVEISTGRRGGGDAGGPQRVTRNDRGYGGGGGDRYGGGGRSGGGGGGGGGRGPPRGGGRGGGGGGRDYDRGRNSRDNDSYGRSGGGRGRDYYDDPPPRNSYSRGGGGDGDYDRAPPAKYRDPSPPSYGSRDRYDSRGSSGLSAAPADRYRPYDAYERRGPAQDDAYSSARGRQSSPPPSNAYYGRSGGGGAHSPSPPGRGRSPLPRAYGVPAAGGGGSSAGRYETADPYDPRRPAVPMARARSPLAQQRGLPPPNIRQML